MATYWKVSPDGKFPLKRKKPFTKHFWILLLWNSSVSCFSRWCIRYGLYIHRKKEKKRTSLNKSSSSSSCFLVGVSQLLPLSSRNCVFFTCPSTCARVDCFQFLWKLPRESCSLQASHYYFFAKTLRVLLFVTDSKKRKRLRSFFPLGRRHTWGLCPPPSPVGKSVISQLVAKKKKQNSSSTKDAVNLLCVYTQAISRWMKQNTKWV